MKSLPPVPQQPLQNAPLRNSAPGTVGGSDVTIKKPAALPRRRPDRSLTPPRLTKPREVLQTRRDAPLKLAQAIAQGKLAPVQDLLAQHRQLLNQCLYDGATPLHQAATAGQRDIVTFLLAHPDIEPNTPDAEGHTALHRLAQDGLIAAAFPLLMHPKTRVDATTPSDDTAWHLAVASGHAAMAQLLEDHGASTQRRQGRAAAGKTPPGIAIAAHNPPLVGLLQKQDSIDPNGLDSKGWAPLHHAARQGSTQTVLQLLAHRDINVLQEGPDGENLLHFAALCDNPKPVIEALHATLSPDRFQALKNARDRWQRWPVSRLTERVVDDGLIALLTPSTPILPMALAPTSYRRGWIVTGHRVDAPTSLMKAGQEAGIDMHANNNGNTPLSWNGLKQLDIRPGDFVVIHCHGVWDSVRHEVLLTLSKDEAVPLIDIARLLYEKGVLKALFLACDASMAMVPLHNRFAYDPTMRGPEDDDDRYQGLDYTIVGRKGANLIALNNRAAALWLEDCATRRANPQAVVQALFTRSAQSVRTLARDPHQNVLAVTHRPKLKADQLDHLSAQEARDIRGQLLLLQAFNGKLSEVEALLDQHRVDLNIQSDSGQTALTLACRDGHTPVVDLLLTRKADVHLADHEGRSPLYMACQHGHTAICQRLLEHGADIEQAVLPYFPVPSPLLAAIHRGHTAIVQMLLDAGADPYKKCRWYGNAWDVARHNNRVDIQKLLPP